MKKRREWQEMFEEASDEVSQWRAKHPRAKFTSIENVVDEKLAKVRAKMIEELVLESKLTDIKGLPAEERPQCVGCGRPLAANGKQKRQLLTNCDQIVEIERSKGYCRQCRVSFFPPG